MSDRTVERALTRAEKMISTQDENDPVFQLADALADLMHWADDQDVIFGVARNIAEKHYTSERKAEIWDGLNE